LFKKSLIALLVLTLALVNAAYAGDPSWTFYGVAHASINSLSDGADSQVGVTSNTSRFGFKGTQPLNEEFTAFWQFESTLDLTGANTQTVTVTTPTYELVPGETEGEYELVRTNVETKVAVGGTTLAMRNTFVGVKHKELGALLVGRHDTPYKVLGRKVEVFPDQLGDHRAMTYGWDRRLAEVVAWKSPDWSGFNVLAAYMFDQAAMGADEGKTAISAMATYSGPQYMLGLAYEVLSSGFGVTRTDGSATIYSDGPVGLRAAGKYSAEKFDLCGIYQSTTTKAVGTGNFIDKTATMMGAGAIFHADKGWDLKGAFYMMNSDTDAADVTATTSFDESDTQATMMAFGVERVFNPTVSVYAQFAAITNGDATNVALGGADSGFAAGKGYVNGATIVTAGSPDTYDNPAGFSVGTVVNW